MLEGLGDPPFIQTINSIAINRRTILAMLLSEAIAKRLLQAIDNDSLIFLCGAGLSMADPSNLISTVNIARLCYDHWVTIEPALDPAFRKDIDQLAAHFHAKGSLPRSYIVSGWRRHLLAGRSKWKDALSLRDRRLREYYRTGDRDRSSSSTNP